MPLTPLSRQGYGLPLLVHRIPSRSILAALAILWACSKGPDLAPGPSTTLHYPAWIAAFGDQLLVVNLDQDLAYQGGAVVAVSTTDGIISGGVTVPNMAGKLRILDDAVVGACKARLDPSYELPLALVAGRFDPALYQIPLVPGATPPFGAAGERRIDLHPFSASIPLGVGFSCSADGTPRAWVGYQSGLYNIGYLAQVDLSQPPGSPGSIVQVNVGAGPPRNFAYDATHDRLYFTGTEVAERAPVRWIVVGQGCRAFDDGVQDELQGGCHVDAGFDLSLQIRGAEPSEIALSSTAFPCTGTDLSPTCLRMYLSVRMYDADLASLTGNRPSSDLGGRFMVVELPEGELGRPQPQLVTNLDLGMVAGDVHVIPRPGQGDLVAATAINDELLWIYDDDVGQMVKVFGRDAWGFPVLGHQPTAIASLDLGTGVVRLFVTSYRDNWVSVVDVPLANPSAAVQVADPQRPGVPWRLGVSP